MLSAYLSRAELADLIGCKETSYACMRRWLDRKCWPYEETIVGFPKVSRAYHDERMLGRRVEHKLTSEPDFSEFKVTS